MRRSHCLCGWLTTRAVCSILRTMSRKCRWQNRKLYTAYGENRLQTHNIGLSSGTVSVRGSGIAEAQEVWVAGRPVPVDTSGSFVTEEILPEGAHTVEVAVLDENGGGELYLRDFEFEPKDWFYVGMADLTLSEGSTSGPIELLQGQTPTTTTIPVQTADLHSSSTASSATTGS